MSIEPSNDGRGGRLRPGEDGEHATFCRICEAFCGMVAKVENGRIVKIGPDRQNPHSTGHICIKGPSARDVAYDPDRIIQPLRRRSAAGDFEPVSWGEALDDIARRLIAITDRDPLAGAVYTGNPAAFSSQLLLMPSVWDELGLAKVFSAGSQDVNPRLVASWLLYGAAGRLPIPDLPSCDFLLILGANPLVSHGSVVTAPRIREDLERIAGRGGVVVVDPRLTETAEKFDHLSIRPGTDAWLLAAMLHVIFDEGLADLEALKVSTLGWEDLRRAISALSPEWAETVCGASADRIRSLARTFGTIERAAAYSRAGLCRGRFSTLATFLGDALNVVTGKFGRQGGWVFPDSPIDTGTVATGYEPSKSRIASLPAVGGKIPSIVLPHEILAEGPGKVRALAVIAGNPLLSAPGGDLWDEALEQLELFFSIDLYVNETNRHAHYVLPAATFLEREDVPLLGWTYMVRPYVQYADAVTPPVGEARPEHLILRDLADRVRRLRGLEPAPPPSDLASALDPLFKKGVPPGRFSRYPEGLSFAQLMTEPHGVMLGEASDRADWRSKIMHPHGRIALWGDIIAAEFARLLAEPPTSDGLRMIGRRELRSINSWMHNVDRLVRSQRPNLLINPHDAHDRGLAAGDMTEVRSAYGTIVARVEISEHVRPGVVSYPHGWGHEGSWSLANSSDAQNVNRLVATDPANVEQVSGASYLDGFEVTLARLPEPAESEH